MKLFAKLCGTSKKSGKSGKAKATPPVAATVAFTTPVTADVLPVTPSSSEASPFKAALLALASLAKNLSHYPGFDFNDSRQSKLFTLSDDLQYQMKTNILSYLLKHNLLNDNLFDRLTNPSTNQKSIQVLNAITQANFIPSAENVAKILEKPINLKLVLNLLNKNLLTNNADLSKMLSLSYVSKDGLKQALGELDSNQLLDQKSFSEALGRISFKLNKVQESPVTKIRRKDSPPGGQSEIVLESEREVIKVLVESSPDKSYPKGNSAKIKKGKVIDQDENYVGIKIYHSQVTNAAELAQHELKYNLRLFERKGHYFERDGKVYFSYPWHHGKPLNETDITQFSLKDRLNVLMTGLKDLNHLHFHYRVHGDIKPQNFIFDPIAKKLHLIDFGSTRKKGSDKEFNYTPAYLDQSWPREKSTTYSFHDDVYSMGLVVASMFPELFSSEIVGRSPLFAKVKIKSIKQSDLTVQEKAIYNLVDAMMKSDPAKRCNSQDALDYVTQLSKEFDTFDVTKVELLTNKTIRRTETNLEDGIRGVTRNAI